MSADKLQYVSKVKADAKKDRYGKEKDKKRKTKKKDAEKEDMKKRLVPEDHAAGGPGGRAVFLSASVCVLKVSFLLFCFSCAPEAFQDRLYLFPLLQSRLL